MQESVSVFEQALNLTPGARLSRARPARIVTIGPTDSSAGAAGSEVLHILRTTAENAERVTLARMINETYETRRIRIEPAPCWDYGGPGLTINIGVPDTIT